MSESDDELDRDEAAEQPKNAGEPVPKKRKPGQRGKGIAGVTKDKKGKMTPWKRWEALKDMDIFCPFNPVDGGAGLFCVPCSKTVQHLHKATAEQHLVTEKHKSAVNSWIRDGRPRRYLVDPLQKMPTRQPAVPLPPSPTAQLAAAASLPAQSASSPSSSSSADAPNLYHMFHKETHRQLVQDDTLAAWAASGYTPHGLMNDSMIGYFVFSLSFFRFSGPFFLFPYFTKKSCY